MGSTLAFFLVFFSFLTNIDPSKSCTYSGYATKAHGLYFGFLCSLVDEEGQ